jgi:hypothetical protein
MTKVEKALTEHVKAVHPRLYVRQNGDQFFASFDHDTFGYGNSVLNIKLHMANPNWVELLREDFKPFKLYFDRIDKVLSLFENDKVEAGSVKIWDSNRPALTTIGFSIHTNIFRADMGTDGGTWKYRLGHEYLQSGPPASYDINVVDFEEWFHIFLHVLARHNVLKGDF